MDSTTREEYWVQTLGSDNCWWGLSTANDEAEAINMRDKYSSYNNCTYRAVRRTIMEEVL